MNIEPVFVWRDAKSKATYGYRALEKAYCEGCGGLRHEVIEIQGSEQVMCSWCGCKLKNTFCGTALKHKVACKYSPVVDGKEWAALSCICSTKKYFRCEK